MEHNWFQFAGVSALLGGVVSLLLGGSPLVAAPLTVAGYTAADRCIARYVTGEWTGRVVDVDSDQTIEPSGL